MSIRLFPKTFLTLAASPLASSAANNRIHLLQTENGQYRTSLPTFPSPSSLFTHKNIVTGGTPETIIYKQTNP